MKKTKIIFYQFSTLLCIASLNDVGKIGHILSYLYRTALYTHIVYVGLSLIHPVCIVFNETNKIRTNYK